MNEVGETALFSALTVAVALADNSFARLGMGSKNVKNLIASGRSTPRNTGANNVGNRSPGEDLVNAGFQ
jgi:hypothetical protein